MRTPRWIVPAAAVAGVAYAVSPLSAWVAVAVALLIHRAVRGLQGAERRWVVSLLAIGLAVRLLAVAALVVTTRPGSVNNPSFFGDGSYAIGRSLWLRSVFLREPMHPRYFMEAFEPYGAGGHNYIHAALQTILGPAPIALHLLTAAIFLAGVVTLYRVTRASYGATPSMVALAATWLSPSWMAWSVTPIKDSLQFTLTVLVIAFVIDAIGEGKRHRYLVWVAGGAAIAMLTSLRGSGLVSIGAAVLAGLVAALVVRWRTVGVAALVCAVLAVTAVAPVAIVQQRIRDELVAAANRHIGHVKSTGSSYMLLDEHLYYDNPTGAVVPTTAELVRFVGRAAVAFVAVPLPWHVQSMAGAVYLPFQAAWYLAVILACAGVGAGFARQPIFTAMLLAHIAVSVAIIAPNSGNIGTLVRHRDGVVPLVMCLSGLGATVVLRRSHAGAVTLRREYA